MKNGTMYGARIKKAFAKIRHSQPKPDIPETDDPIRRLAVAILGVSLGDREGEKAVERIVESMVGWNEVRVSRPFELTRVLNDQSAGALLRCQNLITALNAIYHLEHSPSLDRLKSMGRRDAKQYLDKLAGVDGYASASVNLWSLGGHSIPVSDVLLETLRANDWVDPTAGRAEVQAFLERNIPASEAKEFCVIMNRYAVEHSGGGRGKAGGRAAKTAAVDA